MKSTLDGLVIRHFGETCDMECPYFQVEMGEDESSPFFPKCERFNVFLTESLQRAIECLEADTEYKKKAEIRALKAIYRQKPVMMHFLKRINYAFNPSKLTTIKDLCNAFVEHGIPLEEIKKVVRLSENDFNNALSDHPYNYVISAFRRVFHFPLGEEVSLRDRLLMSARRISIDD